LGTRVHKKMVLVRKEQAGEKENFVPSPRKGGLSKFRAPVSGGVKTHRNTEIPALTCEMYRNLQTILLGVRNWKGEKGITPTQTDRREKK